MVKENINDKIKLNIWIWMIIGFLIFYIFFKLEFYIGIYY